MTKRIKQWDIRGLHSALPSSYVAIRYTPTDNPLDWVQEYWSTRGWVRYRGYDTFTELPPAAKGQMRLFLQRLRTGMLFTKESSGRCTVRSADRNGSDYERMARGVDG